MAAHAVADAIQAQTAELRASVDSIKQLVASLEVGQQQGRGGADAADGSEGGAASVCELRQELRSITQTLHE